MARTSKVIWEGISWFVAALVADLAIGLVGGALCFFLEAQWPLYPAIVLAVIVLIGLPTRAVLRELRQQKKLGPALAATQFNDALGKLHRSEDDPEMWEVEIASDSGPIVVRIFGEGFPHASLLSSARQLRGSLAAFQDQTAAFKERMIQSEPRLRQYSDEIRALETEMICFYEPSKPDEADVFYAGGKNGRCWHGGLVSGILTGLSFDP
jgi:hypothetical protein